MVFFHVLAGVIDKKPTNILFNWVVPIGLILWGAKLPPVSTWWRQRVVIPVTRIIGWRVRRRLSMRGMSAARVRLLAIVLVVTVGSPAAAAFAKSGPITFYFGLKRPDASADMAFFAVSRPGSSTYRRFLSLRQVSSRYGAAPAVRRAFVRQIRRLGLTARIDGSGVFARVSGPVATFDRAFRVRITREFENDRQRSSAPARPSGPAGA
jgi:hypothetical protein